jgi:signal transduction histidine kinase
MNLKLTDEQLLAELKSRFDENKKMLEEERNLIEELNNVNEKLVASEHLKSNFLSNIRNEINNPIAAILELSKTIAEGNVDLNTSQEFAKLIFSEVFDLDFQLRNIFFSAEIEAGECPLTLMSVHIKSLIDSVVKSFQTKIEKKSINLKFENKINEAAIFKTDSEKFHLILSNIIGNAIQFNKENGSIEIIAEIKNEELVVTVTDSGIGISEDQQDKIYDRFHQIEEGSTKTYGGHGLGLSITKALLEILNGDIKLKSELGIGSSFEIKLHKNEDLSDDSIFSSDGNDFIFDNDEDNMLF